MDIYDERDDKYDLDYGAIHPDDIKTETEVQQYYNGKTVLITGATGFIGMLLIEKLLRSCSHLKKLILVVREKKGKSIQTRIKEIFDDVVFQKMVAQNPQYWKKVQLMNGCCDDDRFGLSEADIKIIQDEVNVIYHIAATVRFDEPLRKAYNINVQGTKSLLEIAKQMKFLKGFIYVSTAYSQSHLTKIEEKIYNGAITDEDYQYYLNNLEDSELAGLSPFILNGRYNSYTMTKGLAEEIVGKHKTELPVVIFRPSIVTATIDEPLTSWTNNISGATGVIVGSAVGFLRTLYCDPQGNAEIIPADRLINGMIVVPLHAEKKWYTTTCNRDDIQPVYNFVSQRDNVMTWYELEVLMEDMAVVRNIVADKTLWVFHLSLDKCHFIWLMKFYLIHLLPAPVFILMEKFMKMKPRLWKGYIKLYLYTYLYSFFMVSSWTIEDSNAEDLYKGLSKPDKLIFNCNKNCDWVHYFYYMSTGLGAYIIKYDWNAINNYARLKFNVISTIDRIIVWGSKGMCYYLLYKLCWHLISNFLTYIY